MNAVTNVWVPSQPCGASWVGLNVPHMEQLTVTSPGVLSPLSQTPDGDWFLLIVNGRTFMPIGASPPFAISGNAVIWTSTIYGLAVGDEVNAAYTFTEYSG